MTRMSLTGYLSVQLDRFLKPFVQAVPCDYAKPVKELVFLILGAASIMVSQLGRRMSWGPLEMIHREKRLCRHAKTKSFDDVGLSAALRGQAAGAPWIGNLAEMHFPQAVEIVDFYHAVEHLWDVGEALWGNRDTSAATQTWVRRYRRLLKEGRVDLVMGGIERGQAQRAGWLGAEAAKTVALNLEYFRRNPSRMRYGRFRQMNLPIGTGAVEGACKHVVQSRFKRPGTRWSGEGLRYMLALKVLRLNDQWERLWPHLKSA